MEFIETDSPENTDERPAQSAETPDGEGPPDGGNNTKGGSDDSSVCDCYHEMKEKHEDTIAELGRTMVECGHCIDFLCQSYNSNRLKKSTVWGYNSSLNLFVNMLHNKGNCFEDADYGDINDFFEARGEQGRATNTLSQDESAIKGAVEYMFLENGSDEHSSLLTRLERVRDLTQYGSGTVFRREGLTPEEAELLISSCVDFRDHLMMICAVELGPRSEALRMIKMDSIDFGNKEIELNNTKTGGTYVMPLRDELATLLRHWIDDVRSSYVGDEDNQYLFPSRHGGKIGVKRFNQIVDETAQKAGIQEVIADIPDGTPNIHQSSNSKNIRRKKRVDPHNLRHTFKNLLNRDDISKQTKQYALDHAGDVTDRYGSNDPELFREELREKFRGIDLSDI